MLANVLETATAFDLRIRRRAEGPDGDRGSHDREGHRQPRTAARRKEDLARSAILARSRSRALCIDNDCDRGGVLAAALANLGYDVELASDGEEVREKILANPPDLVFYDASTLRAEGIEGCLDMLEQLSQQPSRNDTLPLVLLTGRPGGQNNLRDSRPPTPPLGEGSSGGGRRAEAPGKSLTVREKDVLGWAARGKTSAEIGIILNLSERTINFHCDNAMRRLNVVNRTQAVAKAVAMGIISL